MLGSFSFESEDLETFGRIQVRGQETLAQPRGEETTASGPPRETW